MPKKIKQRLTESMKKTKKCKKILVNLAINYGSKSEIVEAVNKMRRIKKFIKIKDFEKYLYTKDIQIQIF